MASWMVIMAGCMTPKFLCLSGYMSSSFFMGRI